MTYKNFFIFFLMAALLTNACECDRGKVDCLTEGQACTDANGAASTFDQNCVCTVVCENFGDPCPDGASGTLDAHCDCALDCTPGDSCTIDGHQGVYDSDCFCERLDVSNPCPGTDLSAEEALNAGFSVKTLVVDCDYEPSDFYGLTYQGGLIFYVNPTDGSGLIAAPSDQSNGATWGCEGTDISAANPMEVGSGQANTTAILTGCADAGTAAKICDALVIGDYEDWFLPAFDEINLMYVNLAANNLGNFPPEWYWSSTQIDVQNAKGLDFSTGSSVTDLKNNKEFVRAVRSITE